MRLLLDTDHISILQEQSGSAYDALMSRIAQVPRTDLTFCIISFHEQVLGCHSDIGQPKTAADIVRGVSAARLRSNGVRRRVDATLRRPSLMSFDKLAAKRVRIATTDLRIAPIALSRGLTLLTRNSRDFSKVPQLHIEAWTA